jgi:hypothetical protein
VCMSVYICIGVYVSYVYEWYIIYILFITYQRIVAHAIQILERTNVLNERNQMRALCASLNARAPLPPLLIILHPIYLGFLCMIGDESAAAT